MFGDWTMIMTIIHIVGSIHRTFSGTLRDVVSGQLFPGLSLGFHVMRVTYLDMSISIYPRIYIHYIYIIIQKYVTHILYHYIHIILYCYQSSLFHFISDHPGSGERGVSTGALFETATCMAGLRCFMADTGCLWHETLRKKLWFSVVSS